MAYSMYYQVLFYSFMCIFSSVVPTCYMYTCMLFYFYVSVFQFQFQSSSYLQLHCWTYFLLATEESCIVVSPSLSTSTLLELSSLSLLSSLAPSCCMTYEDGSAHLFALYFSTSILIVPVVVCQRQQNRP